MDGSPFVPQPTLVSAILARNDLTFIGFIEKTSGNASLLEPFGVPNSSAPLARALNDPWIGIFYALMELERIRGNPAEKDTQKRALMDITALSEQEFSDWIAWMKECGAVREEDTRYSPGLHQFSFTASESGLRSLHACVGEHVASNRKLPIEKRQPGAVNFQFLAIDAAGLKKLGEEIKGLRERLRDLSRAAVEAGIADRIVIAETALIDPSKEA